MAAYRPAATEMTSVANFFSPHPVRPYMHAAASTLAPRMTAAAYLYELRRDDEIVATGHIAHDVNLEIGDRVTIAGREGIVQSIIPIRGQNERRLIVQLLPASPPA